jgi:hypothetical protein
MDVAVVVTMSGQATIKVIGGLVKPNAAPGFMNLVGQPHSAASFPFQREWVFSCSPHVG